MIFPSFRSVLWEATVFVLFVLLDISYPSVNQLSHTCVCVYVLFLSYKGGLALAFSFFSLAECFPDLPTLTYKKILLFLLKQIPL